MKLLVTLLAPLICICILYSPSAIAYSHKQKTYEVNRAKLLEGYNWYNEKKIKNKKIEKEADKESKDVKPDKDEDLPEHEKNIKKLQARLSKAHRMALDNPTVENLLIELRVEREMIQKSKIYSERRVAVALMDDQLNNMKNHSNILHRKIQENVENEENFEKLNDLSQEWGLILQVQGGCMHCHNFAPIVLDFADKHGFEVLAATDDGQDFESIEGVQDNGEMNIFNPNRETPILYLVKNDGREVLPISRGINSEAQIINNIMTIDKHIRKLF